MFQYFTCFNFYYNSLYFILEWIDQDVLYIELWAIIDIEITNAGVKLPENNKTNIVYQNNIECNI